MRKSFKYIWLYGAPDWDYTQDGRFKRVKIQKNEKVICSKKRRNFFKNETKKEIRSYHNEDY